MGDSGSEVTQLLLAWSAGDEAAMGQLMHLVEAELRSIARREMAGERPGHTLQPTALVNEVYLRLVRSENVSWKNSAQFRAHIAITMKRILVDHARKRFAKRRNEGVEPLPIDELTDMAEHRDQEIVDLNDALLSLSKHQPRQSRAVELRYFGNLTDEEIGQCLGVSATTAKRDVKKGRQWLRREIELSEAQEAS